jgi:hypothetical protein
MTPRLSFAFGLYAQRERNKRNWNIVNLKVLR